MPSTSSSPRTDAIGPVPGSAAGDGCEDGVEGARNPWLQVRRLGRVPYREAWALQKRLVEERRQGAIGDVLLVVEHDDVVTTGRGTADEFLADTAPGDGTTTPIDVVEVERGGQATWHGPGQIVVYPIVALAEGHHDLHAWLRALEQAGIETAQAFGVPAGRRDGATGVWVGDGQRKLASIGVAASRWVTYHGMAFNHAPDLTAFASIEPCGFDASVMTSMAREIEGEVPARGAVEDALVTALARHLAPFAG